MWITSLTSCQGAARIVAKSRKTNNRPKISEGTGDGAIEEEGKQWKEAKENPHPRRRAHRQGEGQEAREGGEETGLTKDEE